MFLNFLVFYLKNIIFNDRIRKTDFSLTTKLFKTKKFSILYKEAFNISEIFFSNFKLIEINLIFFI